MFPCGPLRACTLARIADIDGLNVRNSRVHNYPPRWKCRPSQELLVIRRNHKTGEVSFDPLRWGLIPYWARTRRVGASRSTPNARPCNGMPPGDMPP
jgi:putative SOS response-associated peptidase YedK